MKKGQRAHQESHERQSLGSTHTHCRCHGSVSSFPYAFRGLGNFHFPVQMWQCHLSFPGLHTLLNLHFPSLLLNFRHYCGKTYTKFIIVIILCTLREKTQAEPQEQRRENLTLWGAHALLPWPWMRTHAGTWVSEGTQRLQKMSRKPCHTCARFQNRNAGIRTSLGPKMGCPGLSSGMRRNEEDTVPALPWPAVARIPPAMSRRQQRNWCLMGHMGM